MMLKQLHHSVGWAEPSKKANEMIFYMLYGGSVCIRDMDANTTPNCIVGKFKL